MFKIGLWTVCLLALALRLYLLEDVSFHDDEARSQHLYIQQPIYHILTHYTPNNHWLSNLLGYGLGQLGRQRFLLRWPSVLFGVLAIPLLALTGSQLFRNKWTGLAAALFLCFSAFHLQWSQQFRGYSPLLFFALLAFFLVYKALQTHSKRYWYGFSIAIILACLSHLYGALMLIVTIFIGMNRLTSRQRWPLAVSLLALAGYATWFGKIYIIDLLHPPAKVSPVQLFQYQWLAFRPTLADMADFLAALAVSFSAQQGQGPALVIFWGLAGAGLILSARQRFLTSLFLGIWFIAPLILVVIADLAVAGFFVFDRYLIFILPAWLLLAAHTLVVATQWLATILPEYWRRGFSRSEDTEYWGRGFSRYQTGPNTISAKGHNRVIFATLLLAAFGYSGFLNFNVAQRYFVERASHDWRTIAAYIAGQAGPADLIVCKQLPHRWPPRRLDWGDPCTKELKRRLADLGLTPHFPIKQLEIVSSLNTGLRFREEANRPGAVWLVIWGEVAPQIGGTRAPIEPVTLSSQRQVRGLPAQLAAESALITFDRLGYTALLKASTKTTLVDNLEQTLDHLARLDTTSPDRFDYYLRRAQVLAYQGRLEEAWLVFDLAGKLLPDEAKPLAETLAAIETITANFAGRSGPAVNDLSLDFGQPAAIRLTGYSLPASLRPGQAAPVTIFWQALAPVSADYTIFLHLRDPANQTVAQLDFRPFDGAYPTYQWPAQSRIEETRLWMMPNDVAPGAYALRLGLYQVDGLTHLPAPGDRTGREGVFLSQVWVE